MDASQSRSENSTVFCPANYELLVYSAPELLEPLQSMPISTLSASAPLSTVGSGFMVNPAFCSTVSNALVGVMGSDNSQIVMTTSFIGSAHTSEMESPVWGEWPMYKLEKFLGVSYEDLEQEVHSLFSEIESRCRSISNPLRRDLSTNLLGAAQKLLENSIIWLAQ